MTDSTIQSKITYPTSPPPAYVQDSPKAKENMNVMTANAAASGSAQEQGSSSSSMTAVDPNRESESQPKNAEVANSKVKYQKWYPGDASHDGRPAWWNRIFCCGYGLGSE
ncbi:hypothetical protein L204_102349 [Cryptococcus depauperatus]